MAAKAGVGDHCVYCIPTDSPQSATLQPGERYVAVDAISWFINKESSWFSDRMASGTLDIILSSGTEHYRAALGIFDLKDGARTAPVFNRPVLADRAYRGGPLTFSASLSGVKKDTTVARLLKSAAGASLGIVAGMVESASASGPLAVLSSAGDELIGGVKTILNDTGEKREPLFDFSGIEFTLQPTDIRTSEVYLLFHRGTPLDKAALRLGKVGETFLPTIHGHALDDGVWLLLRVRCPEHYSGVREWFEKPKTLRSSLVNLLARVIENVLDPAVALTELEPGKTGNRTIYDEYMILRSIIQNDAVITELDAAGYVELIAGAVALTKKTIESLKPGPTGIHGIHAWTGLEAGFSVLMTPEIIADATQSDPIGAIVGAQVDYVLDSRLYNFTEIGVAPTFSSLSGESAYASSLHSLFAADGVTFWC